ncbi:hypothetical protein BB558_000197 [Smittium angustum]|uniref:Uncharacterized protein n=1 Tax=Smittium angustum TaxID=133377 RepID=A0A2U1JEX3_SMIAN|nr:hypothetical protein BB558_000197 [Smittium angustum]
MVDIYSNKIVEDILTNPVNNQSNPSISFNIPSISFNFHRSEDRIEDIEDENNIPDNNTNTVVYNNPENITNTEIENNPDNYINIEINVNPEIIENMDIDNNLTPTQIKLPPIERFSGNQENFMSLMANIKLVFWAH